MDDYTAAMIVFERMATKLIEVGHCVPPKPRGGETMTTQPTTAMIDTGAGTLAQTLDSYQARRDIACPNYQIRRDVARLVYEAMEKQRLHDEAAARDNATERRNKMNTPWNTPETLS